MFSKTLLTDNKSSLFRSNPDIFIVISLLSALVLVTTILSEGFGLGERDLGESVPAPQRVRVRVRFWG